MIYAYMYVRITIVSDVYIYVYVRIYTYYVRNVYTYTYTTYVRRVAADVEYVADRNGGRLPRAQFQAEHGALGWQYTTNSMKMAMA